MNDDDKVSSAALCNRDFLQSLRDEARCCSSGACQPGNEWARAYMALADAADRLDAMQARCVVVAEE